MKTKTLPDKNMHWQELLSYRDIVFCLCLGFARDRADAWDLAQETYAKALPNCTQAQSSYLKAWILRIARNVCLDRARQKKSHDPHQFSDFIRDTDWRTPEHHAVEEERIAIVREAIADLPTRQREVLVMREYGELSYVEIAQILNVNLGTVMSRLNRARQAVLQFYREKNHATAR